MRAAELGTLVTGLFAVPMAINYAINGKPFGRTGVPLGAIDTGKTAANGKAIIVDPQQWTGVRRGMRLTGANAVASGLMRGESSGKIIDNAGQDIIGGFLHPYAGPLVNAGVTLGTGYNASFYKQASPAGPGGSQLAQNAIAAVKQLNPLVGNAIQGVTQDKSGPGVMTDLKNGNFGDVGEALLKGAARPLENAVGVKEAAVQSPEQQIRAAAGRYTESLGIARGGGGFDQPSQYSALTTALRENDVEKAKDTLQQLIQAKAEQIPGNITDATKQAIAKREIMQYFLKDAASKSPFTGSVAREVAFKRTLDSSQQQLYQQAISERRALVPQVRTLLYAH
jgi:hypothetical protein